MNETPPPPPGKNKNMWMLSPWLLVWISAILGLAVLALSVRESDREKEKMIRELADRANALIWALEAGTRTWLGYEGERNVLQQLIEETAKQPNIVYLAVVDGEGRALAHSDRKKVGDSIDVGSFDAAAKTGETNWRETVDGEAAVFEVYRRFAPISDAYGESGGHRGHHGLPGNIPGMRMRGRGMRRGMQGGGVRAAAENSFVLVGLDEKPFRDAMREDLYNSILTAAVVASLGLAGVVSVFWAQNYRRSNREVKRLQEEVARNEHLSALGTLAAGVAHEIRNPLSTIKGLATYMAGKMPDGDRERNAAKTMIQEINRLNNVVSELLGFARPAQSDQSSADVNEAAARALRLADAEIREKGIQVRFRRNDALPRARIRAERLTQAFLNLFLNAVQAMSNGGTLGVDVAERKGAGVLVVTVDDDGEGMTEEVRKSAFNPYFTTKTSGTGLGLSIVHQIITGNGGEISVESSPGAGSSFIIRLPAALPARIGSK